MNNENEITEVFQTITETLILALQGHAIVTGDQALRALAWAALGRSSRYAFEPVTAEERRLAVESCAARLESMRLAGEELRVVS